MNCVLIHYGEIGLKGNNRGDFENQLVRNISAATGEKVEKMPGRLILYPNTCSYVELRAKLSKVFGIAWFAFATKCPSELEAINTAVDVACAGKIEGKKFKIDSKRSAEFSLSSQQLNIELGDKVRKKFNAVVSLDNPELTLFVEVAKKYSFVFTEKIHGLGGLPVGTSGNVLCLLSGGIDSPVSAWMMMKRGCIVDFLHIHALRGNSELQRTKIISIFKTLKTYSPRSKLFSVPFHEFDLAVQNIDPRFQLILFKRFLLMLADKLTFQHNVGGIVTGDSLAQVASQTLESLYAAGETYRPVFRPLIGFDKEEIISIARKIDTYDDAICDYKDCCALVSPHPHTRPKKEHVDELAEKMNLSEVVVKTVENIEEVR